MFQGCSLSVAIIAPTSQVRESAMLLLLTVGNYKIWQVVFSGMSFLPTSSLSFYLLDSWSGTQSQQDHLASLMFPIHSN
jgi:hypothetical protein